VREHPVAAGTNRDAIVGNLPVAGAAERKPERLFSST
jgi:hypothetical protein